MGSVRVAIIGVGNCASALVQGVHYYRGAGDDGFIPGLMQPRLGGYHVGLTEEQLMDSGSWDSRERWQDRSRRMGSREDRDRERDYRPERGRMRDRW